jgi:hypothetical protein
MSFNEFALAVCRIPDENSDGHFRSQSAFYLDSKGEPLYRFLLKYSDLSSTWAGVSDVLNLGIAFPKENLRKTQDVSGLKEDPLSCSALKQVQKRYSKDYELRTWWV